MAQSTVTCTPPSPTPPTNFSCLGTTPPTAPGQAQVDDGTAGSLTVFAAKLASADNANYPSVDAEGKGTETVWTASVPNPSPNGQLQAFSDLGNYTTTPNQQHASSLSPATNPALVSISPTTTTSGSGNITVTATGTAFTKLSVICADGVPLPTTFVSATSLTAPVPKRATAGTKAITVLTGGAIVTPPQTLTFS